MPAKCDRNLMIVFAKTCRAISGEAAVPRSRLR
jgi:hypothetical protein